MRCEEFEERIQQSFDQRIAPWSQKSLLRHTEKCRCCHELLATYEQLCDGLCFYEADPLEEDFSQRVVRQFSIIRTRRRRVALTATVAALAAAVLLAILPSFLSRPVPTDVASPEHPALVGSEDDSRSNEGPKTGTSAAGSPDFEHGIDVEQAHVFWGQWASRLKTNRWAPVDRIAGEFAPITEPLSVAIEEIRSTIPLGRSSRSTEPSSDSVDTWLVPAVRNTA